MLLDGKVGKLMNEIKDLILNLYEIYQKTTDKRIERVELARELCFAIRKLEDLEEKIKEKENEDEENKRF